MLYPVSPLYNRLFEQISKIPVIDSHEHFIGSQGWPAYREPIAALVQGYIAYDLISAGQGMPVSEIERLADPSLSTDKKWPLFKRLWDKVEHTAFARVTKLVLKDQYGEETITRDGLERIAEKLSVWKEEDYFRILAGAGICLMLTDAARDKEIPNFLDGKIILPEFWKPIIPIKDLIPTIYSRENIDFLASLADRHITSLNDFLEAIRIVVLRFKERGAVGMKMGSAYERTLAHDLVPFSKAEELFNSILYDPRNFLGWPESKPLNDFLIHQFLRCASEFHLPVQVHTGHMAGNYDRVDKGNAVHLASVLELYRDVKFDLFHGNWPYMGDLLFLGKNYPNVSLNLCWLYIIDPRYASELLERSIYTMPHTKIHGFGGDYHDTPEYVAGHLAIARETITGTLSSMVQNGWFGEEQAVKVAKDWLYNNPNQFFNLGLAEID